MFEQAKLNNATMANENNLFMVVRFINQPWYGVKNISLDSAIAISSSEDVFSLLWLNFEMGIMGTIFEQESINSESSGSFFTNGC